MTAATKPMYTLSEVATSLNVTLQTANRLANAGKLPAIKVGRVWRIDPERFEAFRRGETSEGGDE